MMKKIGVLTFARVANFGAVLQGMSTYFYLKNNNYIPFMINWEPTDFADIHNQEKQSIQGKAFFDFYDNIFQNSQTCKNEQEVAKCIIDNNIDGIIVGSDAVLQHHPLISRIKFPTRHIIYVHSVDSTRLFPNPFWGCFSNYLKIIIPMAMMSVSSQNSPYKSFSCKTKREMLKSLSLFSVVTVRDNWTKDMISSLSKGRIVPSITPDPVFAFNQNVVNNIPSMAELKLKFDLPDNYILISFLKQDIVSPDWIEELETILEGRGVSLIALPMPDGYNPNNPVKIKINGAITPLEWYGIIKYSLGYIGQNMHPLIVALHNGVPVYSFDSYGITKHLGLKCIESSSKIYHLLKDFNCLENRCCIARRKYEIPTPKDVVCKLDSFDRKKVVEIANRKLMDYNQMMEDILCVLE